jgi:hypothetical protein
LTTDHDRLRDRLEQILSALLPVSESRRDSIKAAALFLDSLSRSPLPGEDVNPTITKQAQRETLQRLGSPHLRIDHLSETDSRILGDALLLLYSLSASLRGEDNPTTTKQAERELLALRKRLGALRLYVGMMSKTAIDAMASAGIGGDDFDRLVQMEEAAQRTLERLRARPGRPHKRRADWITLVAASVFSQLTGTLPALRTNSEGVAYGPFIDLLKAVFEACEISASAEARAKAFVRKFCQPRRELGPS